MEKLGFIPNANGWGEDRSMTPYFGMMVSSYYDKAQEKDTAWLRRAYNAVLKEYEFWTNTNGNTIEDHSTPVEGLQRYGHHSDSATLVSFYDKVLQGRFHLEKMCLRAKRSASRAIDSPKPKRWISTRVSKGGAWISFR